MQPRPDPRPDDAFRPPHEGCPRCQPAPSWGALAATVGTVLAVAVLLVAAVLVGTNVALWAQVGGVR